MGYGNQSDWIGKAIVVVVVAVMFGLVAAFFIGSGTSDRLQWLYKPIGDANAAIKMQEARQIAIRNDEAEEQVRKQRIENNGLAAQTQLALEKQSQVDALNLENAREGSRLWREGIALGLSTVADIIRWGGLLLVAIGGYLGYTQLSAWIKSRYPVSQTIVSNQTPSAVPAFTYAAQSAEVIVCGTDKNPIIVHEESPAEKMRHKFQRELGRHRERGDRAPVQQRSA